jgi:alkanesulfonate monooxygenase SsuD/methylene tetrahydromethanopterin reductase-like flavin-dependent oxidoreductase (luciferase family)
VTGFAALLAIMVTSGFEPSRAFVSLQEGASEFASMRSQPPSAARFQSDGEEAASSPRLASRGSGKKKPPRTVAKSADIWNAMGSVEKMAHKIEVLRGHCEAVGRDIATIEFTLGIKATIRDSAAEADKVWKSAMEHNKTPLADVADDDTFWNGTPEQLAEKLAPFVELGFHTVISEQPAPYDTETLERLVGEVKPLVDRD